MLVLFFDSNCPPSKMPIEEVEILAGESALFLVGSEKNLNELY
jgi:hypothetical protein